MIETKQIKKSFDGTMAVDDISLSIKDGSIFGLIGTNGAGKSTFMRMLAGVLKPDSGEIIVDEKKVYNNPEIKAEICFLSDDHFFPSNANVRDMEKFYGMMYPSFDHEKYKDMIERFELPSKSKIRNYSKGMKKQLQIILGICTGSKYLLCDETFDGLDPVMRQAIKSIFAGEVAERNFTPIIASHNLRELEDICDSVGLLYKGGVVLSKDIEELKMDIHRIQCVFGSEESKDETLKQLDVLKDDVRGSLHLITARGQAKDIEEIISKADTIFCEVLPLTLEEIFISETEVIGYDIKKLIG